MRRATMIFKAAVKGLETPVYIGCSPSSYSDFDAKHWWRRKEDIQIVLSEFVKIGSFVVIERRELRPEILDMRGRRTNEHLNKRIKKSE